MDLGAGGGLSTLTYQALAAQSQSCNRDLEILEGQESQTDGREQRQGEPCGIPFVLAFDTSAHMLATVAHIEESSLVGIRLEAVKGPKGSQVGQSPIDLSAGLPWVSRRGDRILADMSQPLPLRSGVVDAALSVSAVQWLLQLRSGPSGQLAEDVEQVKLQRLFASLKRVAVDNAKLAMQFYPPKGDFDFGARALRDTARKELWTANVVLDFPHHPASTAKKWFLLARLSHAVSQPDPWCALCWPVVAAQCALQSSCDEVQYGRAQQQHAEVALRLARCGRRLRAASDEHELNVQERLRQQLHPLQIELAKRLDEALAKMMDHDSDHEAPESKQLVHGTGEPATEDPHTCKRARSGVNETKTELRSVVASSLPQLISVLHAPPSEEWLLPTPPLDSRAVDEIWV